MSITDTLADADTRRRCTATSKTTGQRCGQSAIKGGHVCSAHGGAAPQTLASARRTLDAMREPALEKLRAYIENEEGECRLCHMHIDPALRLRAIALVLDRTNMGPRATLTVEHEQATDPNAPLSAIVDRLASLADQVAQLESGAEIIDVEPSPEHD